MAKRNCTIEAAVAALAGHRLVSAQQGIVLCACGSWFPTPESFSDHQAAALNAELSAYKTYAPLTNEKLQKIAAAYRCAAPRLRGAAVAALLGCSTQSATYYVHLARKAGFLPAAADAGPIDDGVALPSAGEDEVVHKRLSGDEVITAGRFGVGDEDRSP